MLLNIRQSVGPSTEPLEDHYDELAHHYTKGGNTDKAIEYLHLAGKQAAQRSAHSEAIGHLIQALELLKILDDTPARAKQELALQMTLGLSQMVTKGLGAPEAGLAYDRAYALCRQIGDRPEVIDVLWGLCTFYLSGQSEVKKAHAIAEQLLRVAEAQNDPISLMKAHLTMSGTLYFQGELLAACAHTEYCIGVFDTDKTIQTTNFDFEVATHGRAALTLWLLGYPAQAVVSNTTALGLAHEQAGPIMSAVMFTFSAMVHRWRGETQVTREYAEAALKLSHEYGLKLIWAPGTILHGAALVELGLQENLSREVGEAVAALRGSRLESGVPHLLAAVAEIDGKAGKIDDALSFLGEAIEISTRRGERYYQAELYRLKGEMSLRFGGENPTNAVQRDAEACFEQALEIAKEQSAKSWELRTSTSLARLWQQQGKQAEAHNLLSEIYNWFTEGFDTKDLQDAKALLEALA